MLSLLDFAIDATPAHVNARDRSAAPEILSEDHSAAASDGCASLDTTGGKVSLMTAGSAARKARWHRFGVDVKEATDRFTAARLARLEWTVSKRPMFYRDNGNMRESLTTWGIVRDDNGEQLHTVGTDYEPMQTVDMFDMLDSLMGEFGARYETAGALRGGRQVFMQIQLPQSFEVVRGDGVQTCGTFTNSHAGAKSYFHPTTQRIVCANTFAIAQQDKNHGLAIKHTGNIKEKIATARKAIAESIKGFEQFKEKAEVLVRTKIASNRQAIDVFDGILDQVCDITKADMLKGADALAAAVATTQAELEFKAKQIKRQITKRRDMMTDLQTRLHSETNRVPGMEGTAWAVFNAATEQANHGNFGRQVGTDEDRAARRFDSVMNGAAAAMNDVALEMCLALAN